MVAVCIITRGPNKHFHQEDKDLLDGEGLDEETNQERKVSCTIATMCCVCCCRVFDKEWISILLDYYYFFMIR